jgi:hypothetical protein
MHCPESCGRYHSIGLPGRHLRRLHHHHNRRLICQGPDSLPDLPCGSEPLACKLNPWKESRIFNQAANLSSFILLIPIGNYGMIKP